MLVSSVGHRSSLLIFRSFIGCLKKQDETDFQKRGKKMLQNLYNSLGPIRFVQGY